MSTPEQWTPQTSDSEGYSEGWAILELMGHRRLAGWVSEQAVAGAAFIRIDVPAEPDDPRAMYDTGEDSFAITQFYAPGALYCLTPSTKETVLAVARLNRPAPVSPWELPSPPPLYGGPEDCDEVGDDDDGDDDR